jgi:hypothetical protein
VQPAGPPPTTITSHSDGGVPPASCSLFDTFALDGWPRRT